MYRRNVHALLVFLLSRRLLASSTAIQPVTTELVLARPMTVAIHRTANRSPWVGSRPWAMRLTTDWCFCIDATSGNRQSVLQHSGTIKDEGGESSSQNLIGELLFPQTARAWQ